MINFLKHFTMLLPPSNFRVINVRPCTIQAHALLETAPHEHLFCIFFFKLTFICHAASGPLSPFTQTLLTNQSCNPLMSMVGALS